MGKTKWGFVGWRSRLLDSDRELRLWIVGRVAIEDGPIAAGLAVGRSGGELLVGSDVGELQCDLGAWIGVAGGRGLGMSDFVCDTSPDTEGNGEEDD